jgi:hypothetical protein
MLKYTKNNEQIEYIIDNVKISKVLHDDFSNNFFSNSVHYVIKYSTNECAEYLFNSLNEKQYPFNIIIYNILIKKLPFTQAIKVLLVMRNNGVRPDIYSIFPLLYKWKTIDELLNIIELASKSHIFADSKCEQSLSNRIYELGCKKEIKMTIHKVKIEQSWKDALDHICNK